ncbi:MAG: hypothetical protein H6696_03315 [Deferribacteres bacterium]|nr:hypothetical protein [candidate division KSB1 bacterium]MCB9500945.1 hypothetical protein [Deferribacteres bacterium]
MNENTQNQKPLNDIPARQNEQLQLNRLAAQRMLYDRTRDIKWHRFIAIFAATFVSVVITKFILNSEVLMLLAAGLIWLGDWLVYRFEERQHDLAALIQEAFDCDVLELPWNHYINDSRPPTDTVNRLAEQYNPSRYPDQPLPNWYSVEVATIPLPYARLICQKSNIFWDKNLRRRYTNFITKVLLGLLVLLAVIIILLDFAWLEGIAFIAAACAPPLGIIVRELIQNRESIDQLEALNARINDLWQKVFYEGETGADLDKAARAWQDAIYRHRRTSPVIPRKIYNRFRGTDEEVMYIDGKALAQEVKDKLKKLENEK